MITAARSVLRINKAGVASAASRCKLCVAEDREAFTSFPKQYFTIRKVAGVQIAFRAIQPEDEPLLVEFHKTVSDDHISSFQIFWGHKLARTDTSRAVEASLRDRSQP